MHAEVEVLVDRKLLWKSDYIWQAKKLLEMNVVQLMLRYTEQDDRTFVRESTAKDSTFTLRPEANMETAMRTLSEIKSHSSNNIDMESLFNSLQRSGIISNLVSFDQPPWMNEANLHHQQYQQRRQFQGT